MKKRSTFVLLCIIGWVFCSCARGPEIRSGTPLRWTILFFNDLHGHLLPFEVKEEGKVLEIGGIARLAGLVEEIRKENRRQGAETFLFVAGDILQGTAQSTVFQGEVDIACFNLMGVDAMTVGNHEFDFGLDNFRKLKQAAEFPFLSANIVEKSTGKTLCEPTATFDLSDTVTMTVIGTTTSELLTTTAPGNVVTLTVTDSLDAVEPLYRKAIEKGPVVLLSHCRWETDARTAHALPGLLAVIGGHDHFLMDGPRKVGNVRVFQALDYGRYLGRIDIAWMSTKGAVIESWAYIPITPELTVDGEVQELVDRYQERLGQKFKEVVGVSTGFLDGRRQHVRYEETNLGDLLADLMREQTKADIVLVNGGSIRASISEGPVTMEDLYRALPYEDEILVLQLSGKEIMEALDRSAGAPREGDFGGFLQVSGLRYVIHEGKAGSVKTGVEGSPLDPEKVYSVAVTTFLAEGGDGYAVFKGKPARRTEVSTRQLLIEIFRSGKPVSAKTDGRITRE